MRKVRKARGYPFTGTVVSDFASLTGAKRCVVDNGNGMLHIYNDDQLVPDSPEYQYLDLLRDCLDNGVHREGRNGGTRGVFGRQVRFNLAEGFPLLTTKKVNFHAIVTEHRTVVVSPRRYEHQIPARPWCQNLGRMGR